VAFNYLFNVIDVHHVLVIDRKRTDALLKEFAKVFLKKQIDGKAKCSIGLKISEAICLVYVISKILPFILDTSYEAVVIREVYEQLNKDLP
jgi:hypothetical protein